MYFNFEDNHPDTPRLSQLAHRARARAARQWSCYLLVIILALVVSEDGVVQGTPGRAAAGARAADHEARSDAARQRALRVHGAEGRDEGPPPPPPVPNCRIWIAAPARRGAGRDPKNPLPFARGNTPERDRLRHRAGPRERNLSRRRRPARRECGSRSRVPSLP